MNKKGAADMVVQAEIQDWPLSKQLFAYAESYLDSAIVVNNSICDHEHENTWSNAVVSLMLAAHALELFYKAAIEVRQPGNLIATHDIEILHREYEGLFPEAHFDFPVPFRISKEMREHMPVRLHDASIMYRYPVNKKANAHPGLHGVMPMGLARILQKLRSHFDKVKPLLAA